MKASLLALLLMIAALIPLAAQDRSFGTLPLVNKQGFSTSRAGAAVPEAEAAPIMAIYNRLVQARGDFRFPVPNLVIRDQERSVAWIDYDRLEITLEKKAIEVCRPYGDAAIAFLLAHELTHYYEKHAWRRGFAAEHRDLPIGLTLSTVVDDAAHETEADYLGGFLAYSAGYGLFDQGDAVIRALYQAYGLPAEIGGYPSLDDRATLSRRTAEKVRELVDVFEMANMLAAVGRYREAYTYYRDVLMVYQSREIFNNLGVTAVLDARQYLKDSGRKYHLPLQLDLEMTGTRGSGMATDPTRLLRQAILHFDAAISLDPGYAPAYLNKACALTLLGEYERARFYADTEARAAALANGYPLIARDVDILLGVIHALSGDRERSAALFRPLAEGSAMAAANLRILEDRPAPMPPDIQRMPVERIDELTMSRVSNPVMIEDSLSRSIDRDNFFHQHPLPGPGSRLLVHESRADDELILFHLTRPGYSGKTAAGLGAGSDQKDLQTAYGEPRRMLATPQGQIWVYPNTLFILDAAGKLDRWANYRIMRI
jgi:tetratricopeptide (TPR) repeat protein